MVAARGAIVKMAEMPRGNEVYELRWLGAIRASPCGGKGLEIHTLLAAASGRFVRTWLPLDRLPLLVLGSRWHRQTAIRYSAQTHWIRPKLSQPLDWVETRPDTPGASLPPGWVDPSFPHPGGAWRVHGMDGHEYYLPISELVRTHYVFDPRLLPSILGGVSDNTPLTGRSRQAWHPQESRWLDQPGGIARLRVARFMSNEGAFRLARLWFEPRGRDGLTALFHAFRRLRVQARSSGAPAIRTGLPPVPVPYTGQAEWEVTTAALPPSDPGRSRFLILKIVCHSAAPPWSELQVDDGVARRRPGAEPVVQPQAKVDIPVRLEPLPKSEVKVTSERSDGRFNPLRSRDLRTIDQEAAGYRSTRSERPPQGDAVADPRRGGSRQVDTAGADVPGGSGTSPPLLPGGSIAPEAGPYAPYGRDIRPVLEQLLITLREFDDAFSGEFVPSRETAHRFELPPKGARQRRGAGATGPDKRVKSRQLLIFRVEHRDRFVYIVDPTRRTASERFPFGFICARDRSQLDWEDILDIATAFETSARARTSWIQTVQSTCHQLEASALDHLPDNESWDKRLPGLIDRMADEVLTLIPAVKGGPQS